MTTPVTTTPGYVLPVSTEGYPRNLSLMQFVQTVIVGVSGIDGTLVRPKWQRNPPKNPDIDINWIAVGVATATPDANGYLWPDSNGATQSQRHETLSIPCSLYGPDALEIAGLIRDGFQVPQNRQALLAGNMGFVETSQVIHSPELINERYSDRWEMNVILRREVQRVYPIVTLLSATGTIHTVLGNEEYLLDWSTGS